MTSSNNSNPFRYSTMIINPYRENTTVSYSNSSPIQNYTNMHTQYSSPRTSIRTRQQLQNSLNGSHGRIERHQTTLIDKFKQQIQTWKQNIFIHSSRKKCSCSFKLSSDSETCPKAMRWILSYYQVRDLPKLKCDYAKLLAQISEQAQETQVIQIEKDITRTYGLAAFLDRAVLRRILTVWSIFDPKVGYVQGMNFIVGSLLFHAEEYIAFHLFTMLIGRYEMRDIFQDELPGLTKHCKMIDKLIESYLPKLSQWMTQQDASTQLFISQWLFSLFTVMIPLKYSGIFYDYLFKQNWVYFYKVVLQLLDDYQDIMLSSDFSDTLEFFSKKNLKTFEVKEADDQGINWGKVLHEAALIKINTMEIECILDKFDSEFQEFRLPEEEEIIYSEISEFQSV